MSQIFDRPKEIIEYCLKPLNLAKDDPPMRRCIAA